jgi:WD40 repeat protein
MTLASLRICICAVLWLAISHGALGQERYALLIGNERYSDKIRKLKNPLNDIAVIKGALIKAGFKPENIETVENATGVIINNKRLAFALKLRAAGPDALGFFYYSGHGAASKLTETGQTSNYIIPIDVEDSKGPLEMFASSVPLDDVVNQLRKAAQFADLIIIFDACRNELQMSLRSIDSKTFVAQGLPPNGNTLLSFSTSESLPAIDSSAFAGALAEELVRPDQYHEQVFYNVREAVMQATKQKQIPYYNDGIRKRLYFVQKPVLVDLQEVASWNEAVAVNSVDSYRKFIQQYPASSYAREATRRMLARQEEIDWNITISNGRREDFESYLVRYPDDRFSQLARDQIAAVARAEEDRDWRIAKNSNSEAEIIAFLGKYQRTEHYAEAMDIVRRLRTASTYTKPSDGAEEVAWKEAQRLDSIPVYSKYLVLFGDSANAPQARQKLDALTELRDWEEARDSKLVGGLQAFLKKYSTGNHAEDARELIASLSDAPPIATTDLTKLALSTKGISEDLLQQKRLEQRNLFFPQGLFSTFNGKKIADRLDFRKAQPIRRLLLTNSLTNLYSGGDDGAVRIWDLNDGEKNETLSPTHSKGIYALAKSENTRYLATGSLDRQVHLWDSNTHKIFKTVAVRPQIYSMAFSPTGRWIAAAGTQGQVDFIRVRDQRIVKQRHVASAKTIFALAYLPNKSEDIVVSDAGGALHLWSVVSGNEKYVTKAHNDKILALTVSLDGSLLASAGLGRSIELWTNKLAKQSEIKLAHLHRVTSLRFTPDGRYLASGGGDALIRIWDVKTSKLVHSPFAGHTGDIEDIEFSPDGKYMFTSSEDKTIRIWEVEEAKLLYTLVGFPGGGYVIFDQQQRYLASEDVNSILKGH